jgi:hypothetical protein
MNHFAKTRRVGVIEAVEQMAFDLRGVIAQIALLASQLAVLPLQRSNNPNRFGAGFYFGAFSNAKFFCNIGHFGLKIAAMNESITVLFVVFVATLLVLFVVLLGLAEYRHAQDRKDYKELAENQQNHIKELLEILRFRNGLPLKSSAVPSPAPASFPETVPITTGADLQNAGNGKTEVKKPLGYFNRIKEQEEELSKERVGIG